MRSSGGYFPAFELPDSIDPDLAALLRGLWNRRYRELFEEEASEELARATELAIDALWVDGPTRGHARSVAMGRALALAAEPTVAAHEPDNPEPRWALEKAAAFPDHGLQRPAVAAEVHFPEAELRGHQGLNEALSTLRNLVRSLDPDLAWSALSEMLRDCLEGHAVIPGTAGRRDLFNWWLIEVVPAAFEMRVPTRIYSCRWPWPPCA